MFNLLGGLPAENEVAPRQQLTKRSFLRVLRLDDGSVKAQVFTPATGWNDICAGAAKNYAEGYGLKVRNYFNRYTDLLKPKKDETNDGI